MRHVPQWSPPQTDDPAKVGYLTVAAARDVPHDVRIEYSKYTPDLAHRYFPWQNFVGVTLLERGLERGDGLLPTGLFAHGLLRTRGQVGRDVLKAKGPEDVQREADGVDHFGLDLLGRAEDVSVILREPTCAQQPV